MSAHPQTPEPQFRDGLNMPAIALVGVVSVVLVFACIVGLNWLFYSVQKSEFEEKHIARDSLELRANLAKQQELLASYRWIDREQNIVTIQIDDAMELVLREYGQGGTPSRQK